VGLRAVWLLSLRGYRPTDLPDSQREGLKYQNPRKKKKDGAPEGGVRREAPGVSAVPSIVASGEGWRGTKGSPGEIGTGAPY
jgi:hypothetical protein